MKKLLIKEIRLCMNAQIIIFSLLSMMILIPSWPPVAALMYPLSGTMTLFPRALANKDIEYTTLLPLKKTDVVKGKVLFLAFIDVVTLLLAIAGGIVRALFYSPAEGEEAYFEAMMPCISLIGVGFLAYGVMNFFMVSIYYKNPYKKLTAPTLVSLFAAMIIAAVGQVVIAFVPMLRSYDTVGLIAQIAVAVGGILLFALLTYLGYWSGAKKFQKLDL